MTTYQRLFPIGLFFLLSLSVTQCAVLIEKIFSLDKTKHTAAEFSQFSQKHLQGYQKDPKQIFTGQLQAVEKIAIKGKANTCTRVLFRLDKGAAYSAAARQGVAFSVKRQDSANGYSVGPGLYGPGGVADVECTRKERMYDLKVSTATRTKIRNNLGTGTYSMQVYTKAASEQEIARYERYDKQTTSAKLAVAQQEQRRKAAQAEFARSAGKNSSQKSGSSNSSSAAKEPSSTTYSLRLHSSCSKRVKLFIGTGSNPKYASGTSTWIDPNNSQSKSGFSGTKIWITDDSGNGISSYTLTGNHNLTVASDCRSFRNR